MKKKKSKRVIFRSTRFYIFMGVCFMIHTQVQEMSNINNSRESYVIWCFTATQTWTPTRDFSSAPLKNIGKLINCMKLVAFGVMNEKADEKLNS